MRNIFSSIGFSIVFITGCNASDLNGLSNLTNGNQEYVYQWSAKYPENKNHNLSSLTISAIKIGDTNVLIKSDTAKILEVGGRYESIHNDYIDFDSVYPNISKPEFIIASSRSAGNCCPWANYHIIVLRDRSPALFTIDSTTVEDIRAKKGKSGGYDFLISVNSGIDKAGDSVIEELELLAAGNAILKKGLNDKFPGIGAIVYPADFFSDKNLRSSVLNFKDEEILEVRHNSPESVEQQINWIDNSALVMCIAPVKREWENTQIMVIDLETKGYEIQKQTDSKVTSVKKGGGIIRDRIRNGLSGKLGECFQTQFQVLKTEIK